MRASASGNKNMGTLYDKDRSERATQTEFLERRIEINRTYSSVDFDRWLLERLDLAPGEDILDVGCGSGAQTIPFSQAVGGSGSVSAVDISAESVELLKQRLRPGACVQAVAADMAILARLIADVFAVKRYDLAHSSYALYYSSERLAVLDIMRASLKQCGRCAIFTPNAPHGLVQLAGRFSAIPKEVHDSLSFGPGVLEPYFQRHFPRVESHRFNNVVTLPKADTLIDFYRQTTYHDAVAEPHIREVADREIASTGSYKYEKNGFLIIGYACE
jgi:ubiquinone/menaquinone biosynthesis C-methylase UbiE